jgi:hypothetical protein
MGSSMIRVPQTTIEHLAGTSFERLAKICTDLRAVCTILDGLDSTLPTSRSSAALHERAAMIGSQARQAMASAGELAAVASSYETLAAVLTDSLAAVPAAEEPAAKVATPTKRRRA